MDIGFWCDDASVAEPPERAATRGLRMARRGGSGMAGASVGRHTVLARHLQPDAGGGAGVDHHVAEQRGDRRLAGELHGSPCSTVG